MTVEALKKVAPGTFCGDYSKATDWILNFKEIADINEWSDKKRLSAARRRLTHSAKFWYLTTWPRGSPPETWDEFERKFIAQHCRPPIRDQLLERFRNLQQTKNQTNKDYFQSCMNLCTKSIGYVTEREMVLYVLIGSVSKDMKMLIFNLPTMEELKTLLFDPKLSIMSDQTPGAWMIVIIFQRQVTFILAIITKEDLEMPPCFDVVKRTG